jgi:glycosyltransferase involved in cell wall biosynthesis
MGTANGTLVVAPGVAGPRAVPASQPPLAPPVLAATVVVPCFNHGKFVSKAVQSALAQDGADIRVVVVDDGSDDGDSPGACDACEGERVRVIHQRNGGLPAARNAGAAGATSEFLVFLDADDWLEPTFVKTLAAAIRTSDVGCRVSDAGADVGTLQTRHPTSDLVSHAYCQERLVEKGTGIWRVPDWDPVLMMLTNLHPVTTLVRRSCFEVVGGFTESMTGGYEDWDLWLKFVERGWRGVRVREPLFVWRRHSHSTMIMNVIRDHEVLYRRLIDQHRDLYARHALELAVRSNVLLRRCDMNWLDETLDPINLRALKRQREMYESMLAVRLHHRFHRLIEAMPAPVAGAARRCIGALKRLAPRSLPPSPVR